MSAALTPRSHSDAMLILGLMQSGNEWESRELRPPGRGIRPTAQAGVPSSA